MEDLYTHAVPMDAAVAQLAAAYEDAKAEVRAAEERKDSLANQLKAHAEAAALQSGHPLGTTRVVLESDALTVRVTPVETWRIDSTRMKKEAPETYVRWAKKSVSNRLEVAAS